MFNILYIEGKTQIYPNLGAHFWNLEEEQTSFETPEVDRTSMMRVSETPNVSFYML